jgi:tetratricopeptide (TPR) repeat protein/TolB-like protein
MTQLPAIELAPHRPFGHYEILEHLGGGGMGDVYRARDLTLGRLVAIKVLREASSADADKLARFEQEARSASALNHPNIVTIHEVGSVDGVRYIAMELVDGSTLRELLREAPLLTRRALQLAAQAADGLARAHEAGIVHRDLKPENVMVTREGRVKILDFGLAKLQAPVAGDTPTEPVDRMDTAPGTILGTVGYMSPEQAMGRPLDFRSDQFSCGAILYEMATGRPAFRRGSPVQTLAAIIEDDPEPIASLNPAVPPPLRWIVERCLAKEPADRYVSTTDLARDLAHLLDHLDEVATTGARAPLSEPWPTARRLKRLRLALAGALTLCAVLAVALGLAVGRKEPPAAPPLAAAAATTRARRSVAVLGFKNLSGQPEAAWLSTALAEMLTTELAAGGRLRTIPGENVARMKIELSLPEAESLAPDTLARVGRNLGTHLVLLGSYLRLPGDSLRVDLRLQDVGAGETLASLAESGTETGLVELVTRTGSRLRQSIGVEEPPQAEAHEVAAGAPSSRQAQRLYAEGLARLRVFDALGARDWLQKAAAADPNAPLTYLALSEAWTTLGYDANATEAARKAFALSSNLSREVRLSMEARFRETAGHWAKAIEIYGALLAFYPDNVEYGLRLAAAQTTGGKGAEALATLAALRKLPAPASEDPRIDLTEAAVAQSLGDFKRAREAASRAAAEGGAHGARLLVARARLREAYALDRMGEVERAAVVAEEARKIFAEAGDQNGLAGALNTIGSLSRHAGDLQAARTTWEECLGIRRRIGYRYGVGASLHNLGLLLWEQGALAEARRHFEQSSAIGRELGDKPKIAIDLVDMSGLLYDLGDLAGARKTGEEALKLAREIGDRTDAAVALTRLGLVHQGAGDLRAAAAAYDQALPVLREMPAGEPLGDALFQAGELSLARGDLAGARKHHEEALALRRSVRGTLAVAKSELALAGVDLEEGRPETAEPRVRSAVAVFAAQKAADWEALAQSVAAGALLAVRGPVEAGKPAARAAALARESQSPRVRLSVAAALARVDAARGRAEEARRALASALAEAGGLRLVALQLELRTARAEVEAAAGRAAAEDLAAIARDARALGFGLLARKAEAVRAPRPAPVRSAS